MAFLQDLVHKLDVGGLRPLRVGVILMALVSAGLFYDWRAFRNMASPEAMDAAQLGRNIAEGKGYTTLFIRPLSIYLVKSRAMQKGGSAPAKPRPRRESSTGTNQSAKPSEPLWASRSPDASVIIRTNLVPNNPDYAQLKGMHPDLANPPLYPLLLAGLMKLCHFNYTIPINQPKLSPFWNQNGRFARYPPDFFIAILNQVLFFVIAILVFLLARRLFDAAVAWLSTMLLLGTELLWRFTVSGLSTILLLLIFMSLVWCLTLLDRETSEPKWGQFGLPSVAFLMGIITGLGCLTRYSFGWIIIPVLLALILFTGRNRVVLAMLALFAFTAVMTPWLARNYNVSGRLFGTAGYAVIEQTLPYPGTQLQRSLEPDLGLARYPYFFWAKLMTNARQIILSDIPKLGGSWVTAFFLVGLLVGFRNPTLRRIRYFVLMCVVVLIFTQALGRTQLSDETPEVNSENLLVLLTPLVLVFGVSLFSLLLDQLNLPSIEWRYLVMGVFCFFACLPLVLVFLPPTTSPVVYPPYNPPLIQIVSSWMKEEELIMSDVPWATAWSGRRQSVWLTLRATTQAADPGTHEDFFAINDYDKAITALYLTPELMDSRFFSQWVQAGGEGNWGSLVMQTVLTQEVPATFPLRRMPAGFLNYGQIFLTDWERWPRSR